MFLIHRLSTEAVRALRQTRASSRELAIKPLTLHDVWIRKRNFAQFDCEARPQNKKPGRTAGLFQ